jgi:leucyl-tRNA---protein transferase
VKPGALNQIKAVITSAHTCGYLPDRDAQYEVVLPVGDVRPLYGELINHGFRRSGNEVYRPRCATCRSCISLRVPVAEFQLSRSQRRTWQRNLDLAVSVHPGELTEERLELFTRYLTARHAEGGMDELSVEELRHAVLSHWAETNLIECRLGERLVAVGIVDVVPDGLSAVYTFFDPEHSRRGLGTQMILLEIEAARARGLAWVYLGYWVREAQKMRYKSKFRPYELCIEGQWMAGTEEAE